MESQLKFTAHVNERLAKAKSAEIQVKRLCGSFALAPGLVICVQIAAVQFIALYGAELWWKGQKNHEGKIRQLINRQARTITGMYPSTLIQALVSEAGLVPAQILLGHRQRMYAYRLLTLPNDHLTKKILPVSFRDKDADFGREDQSEDPLTWASREMPSSLGQWLARQIANTQAVDRAYGVEPVERSWQLNTNPPLEIVLQPRQEAIQEAKRNQDGLIFWTDGSRSDKGKVGAAIVWFDRRLGKWQEKRRFLRENKDPYDAELWAIADALVLGIRKIGNVDCTRVTIFTDSQAAVTKISDQRSRVGGDAIRNLIY